VPIVTSSNNPLWSTSVMIDLTKLLQCYLIYPLFKFWINLFFPIALGPRAITRR
jgi:hypothetical protein